MVKAISLLNPLKNKGKDLSWYRTLIMIDEIKGLPKVYYIIIGAPNGNWKFNTASIFKQYLRISPNKMQPLKKKIKLTFTECMESWDCMFLLSRKKYNRQSGETTSCKSNKTMMSKCYSYLKLINFLPANNNWVVIQVML